MTRTCSWGICLNTDRKNPNLRFVPFVKPYGRFAEPGRAARWVKLCGRKNFTVENIRLWKILPKTHTFVLSIFQTMSIKISLHQF